jgi:hypothetical protein
MHSHHPQIGVGFCLLRNHPIPQKLSNEMKAFTSYTIRLLARANRKSPGNEFPDGIQLSGPLGEPEIACPGFVGHRVGKFLPNSFYNFSESALLRAIINMFQNIAKIL